MILILLFYCIHFIDCYRSQNVSCRSRRDRFVCATCNKVCDFRPTSSKWRRVCAINVSWWVQMTIQAICDIPTTVWGLKLLSSIPTDSFKWICLLPHLRCAEHNIAIYSYPSQKAQPYPPQTSRLMTTLVVSCSSLLLPLLSRESSMTRFHRRWCSQSILNGRSATDNSPVFLSTTRDFSLPPMAALSSAVGVPLQRAISTKECSMLPFPFRNNARVKLLMLIDLYILEILKEKHQAKKPLLKANKSPVGGV